MNIYRFISRFDRILNGPLILPLFDVYIKFLMYRRFDVGFNLFLKQTRDYCAVLNLVKTNPKVDLIEDYAWIKQQYCSYFWKCCELILGDRAGSSFLYEAFDSLARLCFVLVTKGLGNLIFCSGGCISYANHGKIRLFSYD